MIEEREIRHFHLFCGLGGGARGFNRAHARVGNLVGRFRCIGGVDSDPAAIADFNRLACARGTVLDLFDRSQYVACHGKEPPAGWREATPQDLRHAAGGERPHIIFTSPPCKGFSGLLSETRSRTGKYQALNELTLRGLWLAMEAWSDDPPEFVLLENVPRIENRGRHLLEQIRELLQQYGYAVRETKHDCGELGGLAQSRKRFLLVARHQEKVPPFLYEPEKKPLRAVGDVLGRMPLPGDLRAGPMHRLPALQWKTWVRLAFVEAGSDWRSLKKLRVENGVLADYLLVPEMRRGALGVTEWADPSGVVTGNGRPATGKFSVADPRIDAHPKSMQHGVLGWHETAGVVTGKMFVGGGAHAVADPRMEGGRRFVYRVVRWNETSPAVTDGAAATSNAAAAIADPRVNWLDGAHENKLRVTGWQQSSRAITGADRVGSGALCVADPRPENWPGGKYRVTGFEEQAGAVIAASTTGNGAFAVADPRMDLNREGSGCYGVVPWDSHAGSVIGRMRADNGFGNVADPRIPAADDRLVALIVALDGTWHRPFTTFELAGLQSLVDPEEYLELEGLSDSAWRERIGNAVPPEAAEAIGGVMGTTLLLAWSGETFRLSSTPIWVRDVAIALSVRSA